MSEKIFECHNCGSCCGVVPITLQERLKIEQFLKSHPEIKKLAKQKPFSLACVFRDEKNKKCLIYPSRPEICKHFQCGNEHWKKNFTVPTPAKNDNYPLINEYFGAPNLKDVYITLRIKILTDNKII